MGGAKNLSWAVPQENGPSTYGNVPPLPGLIQRPHNATTALAVGAEATIFVRFNPEYQYPIPDFKMVAVYEQSFQIKQFSDKLGHSHRFLLFHGVCLTLENRKGIYGFQLK